MSQRIWTAIDPETTSGTMLAAILTDFKDAILTSFAGTSRPAQLQAGAMWIDTTNQAAPNYHWAFKIWTGTTDIEVFRINVNTGFGGALTSDSTFEVRQISADTAGAILGLIKNRIATNGQVLDGDTVGEIRLVGRTNTSTDPVVAYIKWAATDDETVSVSGGYLTFYSTPDASSTIKEHLKLVAGAVETTAPLKLNSLRLVSQNIATTATIAQLSAAKAIAEFTGSTATAIQGINSGHDSQEITLHNRSSANITLKNQNGTAAAADRIKLPFGSDFVISPEGSATLFYCTTDSRWKIKETQRVAQTRVVETFYGVANSWVCPTGVGQVRVTAYDNPDTLGSTFSSLDAFGNAYAWGAGLPEAGFGDLVTRSSPVAVAGGLSFRRVFNRFAQTFSVGITKDGKAYSWGTNTSGQLGTGDAPTTTRSSPTAVAGGLRFSTVRLGVRNAIAITPDGTVYGWGTTENGALGNGVGTAGGRSSPVAVLGGFKFAKIEYGGSNNPTETSGFGLTSAGVAYGWGRNVSGQLGIGDTTDRSSPVAVLGGLIFSSIYIVNGSSTFGLTPDGDVYAWGANINGQLALGDVTPRSSPVAILGGLKFKRLIPGSDGGTPVVYGLTADGTCYGWGMNLGSGLAFNTPCSSPVAILGGLKFTDVMAYGAVLALTADGTLYAWGSSNNPFGALGVGDTTNRSSPVAVLGGLKFAKIATSVQSVGRAITANGTMYAWGRNDSGQLGVGDLVARSSPVAVLGGIGFKTSDVLGSVSVSVVAGQTYRVQAGDALALFGNTCVAMAASKITVEYDKRGN